MSVCLNHKPTLKENSRKTRKWKQKKQTKLYTGEIAQQITPLEAKPHSLSSIPKHTCEKEKN